MSTPVPPTMSAPPSIPTETGSKSRRGCLIAVLVVVLLLIAACGGGCVYVMRNPGKFAGMSLGWGREGIIASLATACTEQQKADFTTEYDAYLEFLRGLDMAAMQAAGPDAQKLFTPAQFLGEISGDKTITPDEADRFIELARGARSLKK